MAQQNATESWPLFPVFVLIANKIHYEVGDVQNGERSAEFASERFSN